MLKPEKTAIAEEVKESPSKPAETLLKKLSSPESKAEPKSEPKPEKKAVAEPPKPVEPLVKKVSKPEKKAVAEVVSLSSEDDVAPQKGITRPILAILSVMFVCVMYLGYYILYIMCLCVLKTCFFSVV